MTELTRLTISAIRKETEDVKTFLFQEYIPYQAGQYLTFVTQQQGQDLRRSYSIMSSPALHEPMGITVKRMANGAFSRPLIDHAKTGDELYVTGSAGFFVLPENISSFKQLFFFAAGSGIVPIYSLIKTALINHPHLQIILIYSNHSISNTIFYTDLLSLKVQHPKQLFIEWLFSDNQDLRNARLNKEVVNHLLRQYQHNIFSSLYYLCGPFAYMRNTFIALEEAGISASLIRKENFNTERTVLNAIPPDKAAHKVSIVTQNNRYEFQAGYPESILKAAKTTGISLPYSCENGQCGSCAMVCTSGNVWMSSNEVLTERELKQGFILTCTGYPQNGDVVLQLP